MMMTTKDARRFGGVRRRRDDTAARRRRHPTTPSSIASFRRTDFPAEAPALFATGTTIGHGMPIMDDDDSGRQAQIQRRRLRRQRRANVLPLDADVARPPPQPPLHRRCCVASTRQRRASIPEQQQQQRRRQRRLRRPQAAPSPLLSPLLHILIHVLLAITLTSSFPHLAFGTIITIPIPAYRIVLRPVPSTFTLDDARFVMDVAEDVVDRYVSNFLVVNKNKEDGGVGVQVVDVELTAADMFFYNRRRRGDRTRNLRRRRVQQQLRRNDDSRIDVDEINGAADADADAVDADSASAMLRELQGTSDYVVIESSDPVGGKVTFDVPDGDGSGAGAGPAHAHSYVPTEYGLYVLIIDALFEDRSSSDDGRGGLATALAATDTGYVDNVRGTFFAVDGPPEQVPTVEPTYGPEPAPAPSTSTVGPTRAPTPAPTGAGDGGVIVGGETDVSDIETEGRDPPSSGAAVAVEDTNADNGNADNGGDGSPSTAILAGAAIAALSLIALTALYVRRRRDRIDHGWNNGEDAGNTNGDKGRELRNLDALAAADLGVGPSAAAGGGDGSSSVGGTFRDEECDLMKVVKPVVGGGKKKAKDAKGACSSGGGGGGGSGMGGVGGTRVAFPPLLTSATGDSDTTMDSGDTSRSSTPDTTPASSPHTTPEKAGAAVVMAGQTAQPDQGVEIRFLQPVSLASATSNDKSPKDAPSEDDHDAEEDDEEEEDSSSSSLSSPTIVSMTSSAALSLQSSDAGAFADNRDTSMRLMKDQLINPGGVGVGVGSGSTAVLEPMVPIPATHHVNVKSTEQTCHLRPTVLTASSLLQLPTAAGAGAVEVEVAGRTNADADTDAEGGTEQQIRALAPVSAPVPLPGAALSATAVAGAPSVPTTQQQKQQHQQQAPLSAPVPKTATASLQTDMQAQAHWHWSTPAALTPPPSPRAPLATPAAAVGTPLPTPAFATPPTSTQLSTLPITPTKPSTVPSLFSRTHPFPFRRGGGGDDATSSAEQLTQVPPPTNLMPVIDLDRRIQSLEDFDAPNFDPDSDWDPDDNWDDNDLESATSSSALSVNDDPFVTPETMTVDDQACLVPTAEFTATSPMRERITSYQMDIITPSGSFDDEPSPAASLLQTALGWVGKPRKQSEDKDGAAMGDRTDRDWDEAVML